MECVDVKESEHVSATFWSG